MRGDWDAARAELETREAQLQEELESLRVAVDDARQRAEAAAEAERRAESLSNRLAETRSQMTAEAREREEAEHRLVDTETRLNEIFAEGRRVFVQLRSKNKRLEHANNRAAWRKVRFDRLRDRHRTIVRTLSSFEKSALRLLEASQGVSALQKTVRDLQVQWMTLTEEPPAGPDAERQRNELKLRLDAARGERDEGVQRLQVQVEDFGRAAARERAERLGRRQPPSPAAAPDRGVQFPLPDDVLARVATAASGNDEPDETEIDGYGLE